MPFPPSSSSSQGKYRKVSAVESAVDSQDDYIMSAVRSQQQMMVDQDESLDVLGTSAARLGMISMEISNELQDQNRMLDGLGRDLDNAEDQLTIVTAKTQELIKKSGGCGNFSIIVCLVLVVVILFFLIMYT